MHFATKCNVINYNLKQMAPAILFISKGNPTCHKSTYNNNKIKLNFLTTKRYTSEKFHDYKRGYLPTVS